MGTANTFSLDQERPPAGLWCSTRTLGRSRLPTPTTQIYPHPGWVNQDAAEIWLTTLQTAREALQQAGLSGRDLAGIGIVNQRETLVVWDRVEYIRVACNRLAEPPEPATDRGAADAGHGAGLRKQDGLGPRRLFHGVETCLAP